MKGLDKRIVKHLLDKAISQGHYVTVHDGEGFVLSFSQDIDKIFSVLESTEMDMLYFSRTGSGVVSHGGNRLGRIDLVHGNEPGVIVADHSDNDYINSLLEGAPEE